MNENRQSWFCPACGTQNTGRFCKQCGRDRGLNAAGNGSIPQPPPQPQYKPNLGYVNQPASNNNTVLMAVIGILVVVLVGGGFYFLNSKPSTQSAPPAQPPAPTATVTNTTPQQPQYKTGHVVGTEVRVRSGPGTQYEIEGEFAYGEALTILEIQSDWYKVKRNNGQVGWIKNQFCSID